MAQPEIEGAGPGKLAMIYGSDGTDWIAALIDALGHLQVDVVASGLPSGGATEATLASALTALQSLQNLVGALHDVGLDELDVQVIASALPTGAATETTLDAIKTAVELIDDLRGALGSVDTDDLQVDVKTVPYPGLGSLGDALQWGAVSSSATWTEVLSVSGPGVLEGIDFSSNYASSEIRVEVDAEPLLVCLKTGAGQGNVAPDDLNGIGGESFWWSAGVYDADNDHYSFFLKRALHYKDTLLVEVRQESGVNKNISCQVWYRLLA